ncbi:MAG: DUF1778 domain-containing protein [Coriobacteriia bacterium]|nr:DUF1778 domain-containing protein [Coriobacteriia bacterium]
MSSETLTIRLDSAEKELIAKYAEVFGCSTSEFMRRSALERIEDELDLREWEAAKAEYDKNPVSYSLKEVMEEFGIL